jgi:hypothetical protein
MDERETGPLQRAPATPPEGEGGRIVTNDRPVSILFGVAGLYDAVLGLVFLVAPAAVFDRFGVTPPNHFGYVQFPAALLIVFSIMFFAVALRPRANKNLIPYGVLLKVSYCGLAFGYWIAQGIPGMWKPFAVADLAFAALFAWAWFRD